MTLASVSSGSPNPRQKSRTLLVLVYARRGFVMAVSRLLADVPGDESCEAWPYLDQEVLKSSRSCQVCITCHWFRHHAGVNCIPLLTCQLHEGLISQGEHLTRRCPNWSGEATASRGWAPEAA